VGEEVVAGWRAFDRSGVRRTRLRAGEREAEEVSDELRLLPRRVTGDELLRRLVAGDELWFLRRCVAGDDPWFLPSCLAGDVCGGVGGCMSSSSSLRSSSRKP
jgi:hypothetical protein